MVMQVAYCENTFKVDFFKFLNHQSFEEVQFGVPNSWTTKMASETIADDPHTSLCVCQMCRSAKSKALHVVEQHNERHESKVDALRYKVCLTMHDQRPEVKIHNLSENVTNAFNGMKNCTV